MKHFTTKSKRRLILPLALGSSALAFLLSAVCVLQAPFRIAQAGITEVEGTEYSITSDTTYAVTPSVEEHKLVYMSKKGIQNLGYTMEIDMSKSDVSLAVSYTNMDPKDKNWGTDTVRNQVTTYNAKYSDENVVGAVNGDIFFMSDVDVSQQHYSGRPKGPLVMHGKQYQNSGVYAQTPYFAVFSDGSYGLFDYTVNLENAAKQQSEKQHTTVTVTEAIGGFYWLLKNGELADGAESRDGTTQPRTSIGITDDNKIILQSVDGRQAPLSLGVSSKDQALYLKQLGCKDAIAFDGGGSTTFLTKREGEEELTVRNVPSDGSERACSSCLLVLSTATGGGEFNHANITPQNEYYTPGSSVELDALSADAYGAKVDFPENANIEWKVDKVNAGTFEEVANPNGSKNHQKKIFKANDGFEGDVEITICVNGDEKGKTTLGFHKPDNLTFGMDTVALDYGLKYDFGMRAYYQQKEVTLKDDDIEWSKQVSSIRVNGVENPNENDYPIGTFEGLKFKTTQNWKISATATITAKIKGAEETQVVEEAETDEGKKLSATVTIQLGMEPEILIDGGDTDGLNYSSFGLLNNGTNPPTTVTDPPENGISCGYYGRGGQVSLTCIEKDDDGEWSDIIRFGDHALKLDYDFSNEWGTEGADFGPSKEIPLEGAPNKIGAWVYAPEHTPNLWLRSAVGVSSDGGDSFTWQTLNFTDEPGKQTDGTQGGINWEGWKYVEADLTPHQGKEIKILAGDLIRLMYVDSGSAGKYYCDGTECPKTECKGYILVDKIQIVYGTNTEDKVEPVIEAWQATSGGTYENCTDGTVYSSSKITFRAMASDSVQTDKFNTGIEYQSFKVDGVTQIEEIEEQDGYAILSRRFPNGKHSVTYTAQDQNGNTATRTYYFTVDDKSNTTPYLTLDVEESAYLGGTATFKLVAHGHVKALNFSMLINSAYEYGDVTLANELGDDSGTEDQKATANGKRLTMTIEEIPSIPADGVLATITVKIPYYMASGSKLSYSANCTYEPEQTAPQAVAEPEQEKMVYSFRTPTLIVEVESYFDISAEVMIVELKDGKIVVFDKSGKPVEGAEIFVFDTGEGTGDVKIGSTNSEGIFVPQEEISDDYFTQKQQEITIYAKKDGNQYSFPLTITSYDRIKIQGDQPTYYVIFNVTEDPARQKNISWLSYINDKDASKSANKIQYALSNDFTNAMTLDASTSLTLYTTSKDANYVHNVEIFGLEPSTTYYFRVGDGTTWSEAKTFTTANPYQLQTNFFLMGDMQSASDADNATKIADLLQKDEIHYDFGIQTGDAVDDPSKWDEWDRILQTFSTHYYGESNVMHVVGNHEIYGTDPNADITRDIFGVPADRADGWYSYEYGQVYVAVFGYTTEASRVEEFGKWLKQDAAASDAKWKIVVTHVAPYGTNPSDSAGEKYRKAFSKAMTEANIDFVFSGNDHAYARSKPIRDDVTLEETEKGTVYFIIGTVGEKKYDCNNVDERFVKATQEYDAIYMTVTASNERIEITAWNVKNGTAEVFDSLLVGKKKCDLADHKFEYDSETNYFHCTECDFYYHMIEDADTLKLYTGLVDDKVTGSVRYLVGGEFFHGNTKIVENGKETWLYFDKNGIGLNGDLEIGGETVKFEKGAFVPTEGILDAGCAGETVYYVLKANGEFKLVGSGAMYDFASLAMRPYDEFCNEKVKSIFIGKDITVLGRYSFPYCRSCESVIFEEGSQLRELKFATFISLGSNIQGRVDVRLPDSVRIIGEEAFRGGRTGLIYLPDKLERMYENTFRWKGAGCNVSVAEGSYAHQTVKAWTENSKEGTDWATWYQYEVRCHMFGDKSDSFTGVIVIHDRESTEIKGHSFEVNGKEVSDLISQYEAIAASANFYNDLSAEEKQNRASEYELLKTLASDYNQTADSLNRQHEESRKVGFAGLGAVVGAGTLALAAAWISRRKWMM